MLHSTPLELVIQKNRKREQKQDGVTNIFLTTGQSTQKQTASKNEVK
jgi:hypothetical protein